MASDWDAESSEGEAAPAQQQTTAARRTRFQDEDASSDEDVKDSWDASDSDDDEDAAAKKKKAAEAAAAAAAAKPVRAKGITKQKIAEKEAAEKARVEALQQNASDDPAARRQREKAAQLRADLDNAAALFGGTSVSGGDEDPFSMPTRTKDEFDAFANALAQRVMDKCGNSPLYAVGVESLARALVQPLKDIDTRKVASTLTAVANEKQRAQKDAQGGGKKKNAKAAARPNLAASKSTFASRTDVQEYGEVLDDGGYDDDFM